MLFPAFDSPPSLTTSASSLSLLFSFASTLVLPQKPSLSEIVTMSTTAFVTSTSGPSDIYLEIATLSPSASSVTGTVEGNGSALHLSAVTVLFALPRWTSESCSN